MKDELNNIEENENLHISSEEVKGAKSNPHKASVIIGTLVSGALWVGTAVSMSQNLGYEPFLGSVAGLLSAGTIKSLVQYHEYKNHSLGNYRNETLAEKFGIGKNGRL